jgi:anti-sigma factor RsiW
MTTNRTPTSLGAGSTCDEVRELLSAYSDDELPPRLTAAVSAHLAGCDACARDLEGLRRNAVLLRQVLPPPASPDVLRARVRAAIRDAQSEPRDSTEPPGAPLRRRASWAWLTAAGVAVAATSSAITLAVTRVPRPAPVAAVAPVATVATVAHEAVRSHIRSLMADRMIAVASTDQHTVKPWFNGRVDFSPDVLRLDSLGFPLLGGRVDNVGDHAVAAIVYGRGKHLIDVFTWPDSLGASAGADTAVVTERGYHVLHWTGDGMECWAVSDVAVPDLREFADAWRRASESPRSDPPARRP